MQSQVHCALRQVCFLCSLFRSDVEVEHDAYSELHVFRGHQPSGTGFIMGHEFTAVVEEVGSAVKHFKKGDKVVSPFTLSW